MKVSTKLTAKQRAYDYIRNCIVQMIFREGEFLTETQIGNQLGISRTPVREACLLLESEGLVKILPQKGVFIPPIIMDEVEEVMTTRIMVELFAVDCLAEAPDQGVIDGLEEIIRQQQRLLQERGIPQFIELDRQFHHLLVTSVGNSILLRLYLSLRDRQLRMGIRAVTNSPERMQQVVDEHEQMVAAIKMGNRETARDATKAHLQATLQVLKQRILG